MMLLMTFAANRIMNGLIRRRAAVPSPRRYSASTRLADAPRYSAETAPARFAHAKASKGSTAIRQRVEAKDRLGRTVVVAARAAVVGAALARKLISAGT